MKITWQRTVFAFLVTSVLLGSLNLQKAHAQNTGAVAARQKPLYARLEWKRTSPSDLELAGDLLGTPPNNSRYITREQLLALPQVSFTVTNDPNFAGPAHVSGVALEELIHALSANPQADLALAICIDKYEAHFPNAYIAAHHPVLALKINGKDPAGWPKFPASSKVIITA